MSLVLFGVGKNKAHSGALDPDRQTVLLLFLCSFLMGFTSCIPKLYTHFEPRGGTFTLLFYNGLGMIPTSTLFLLAKKCPRKDLRVQPGLWLLVLYMGLTNMGSVALLVIALRRVAGSSVYPLRMVVNVLSIFIFSFFFFREKANILEMIGVVIALTGLVLVTTVLD